jgi:hypothetical protein
MRSFHPLIEKYEHIIDWVMVHIMVEDFFFEIGNLAASFLVKMKKDHISGQFWE